MCLWAFVASLKLFYHHLINSMPQGAKKARRYASGLRYLGDILFCLFDCYGTVECYAFFAEVAEVTVVGGNCELAFGNTVAFEELGNAFCTVFAESHVNIVGAGVVISPTGNGIFFTAVLSHHVSDSLNYALVFAAEARNTDGIVNCSEGAVVLYDSLNRTAEAVFELLLEVSDASVSSCKAGTESVAVFGFGDNRHNRSYPVTFLEVVGEAEVSLECKALVVTCEGLKVVETGGTKVK